MDPTLAALALIGAFVATLLLAWLIGRRIRFGFLSRRLGERNWFVRTVRGVFFVIVAIVLAPVTFGAALGFMAGTGVIGD